MIRMLQRRFGKRGFTLMEILVAVVVIGILAGVAASAVPGMIGRSHERALSNQLATLQQAVDRYVAENGVYPSQATGSLDGTNIWAVEIGTGDPNSTIPEYLLSVLSDDPGRYGLSGDTLYWGVVCSGLVFATTTAPTAHIWADDTLIHVAYEPKGISLSSVKECPSDAPINVGGPGGGTGGPGGPGGPGSGGQQQYTLTLSPDAEETTVNGTINVTATVEDSNGNPVSGVEVKLTWVGSVSGAHVLTETTDQDGKAVFPITTNEPEYVMVSAEIVSNP